jgi:tetratricopeptide (TPR) repeat protein
MQEKEVVHYCQKCLAANPLGQDFCTRCGTRLMIIVEPASMRYETTDTGSTDDDHLLERISGLENRLGRLADRVERALDLLLRQAQNTYFDRSLLKSLIGLLADDGVVQNEKLDRLWQERCKQDAAVQEQSNRRDELRAKIVAHYRGSQRAAFEQFVIDGFLLLEDENASAGLRALQRAAELDAHNIPLLAFVGEHCFRMSKIRLARDFLTRALEAAPEDNHVLLLLGLVCADAGDADRAKELLKTATRRGGSSFAAHYGLGRLFAAEQEWRKALREFRLALATKPSPEAHYALGCLYYQMQRDAHAIRHLLAAVQLDGTYVEALQLLCLAYKRSGKPELAQAVLENAASSDAATRRAKSVERDESTVGPPAPFGVSRGRHKRLLTGGDPRLAAALREDALKVFAIPALESR